MVKHSDATTKQNKDEYDEMDDDPIPHDVHHRQQQEQQQQQQQHIDNDYIDYSCSTSIERLARDVETILHAWHVDDGSDRHVSTACASKAETSSSTVRREKQNITGVNVPLLLRSEFISWNVSFYYNTPSLLLSNNNTKSTNHHPYHPPPQAYQP